MVGASEGDYMMVGGGDEGECMVVMVDLVVRLRERMCDGDEGACIGEGGDGTGNTREGIRGTGKGW